jgi:hypothetical protein
MKRLVNYFFVLLFLTGISNLTYGQKNVSSKFLKKHDTYVEYLKGNMPLIISVPHGGYEKTDSIPERMGHYAKNQDIYTIEIAYIIYDRVFELYGRHPHIIINHLHRTRLDANRNIKEAAGGNKDAERIWTIYHGFIDSIANVLTAEYGKGLFIDLHGHRHKLERMELGYLLSAEELQMEDELLNSGLLNEYSSIRYLLDNNEQGLQATDIIYGEYSLGKLLTERGQPCMPSMKARNPLTGEPYFSGGYNTMRHGSFHGGTIDGIQIEVDLHTRSNKKMQKNAAEDISYSLVQFLSLHKYTD